MGGIADSHAAHVDTSSVEATYTSLIQQYLSVLCIDNATFLAERFVAACKTSHSYYLLAICHYRVGSPQRAQRVLEDCKDEHSPEMQYLLAKCYAELQQYGPAEDALLQNCRALFRKSEKEDIDEWILTTTPCPVPNGAAGLQLMGHICRNSNRKERAMHYFRLALKLDPMMWTSYEALCEMGDDSINPVQVFGVRPEALARSPQEEEEQEEASQPYVESRGVLTPSFALSHHAPAETPMSTVSTVSRLPNKSLFAASSVKAPRTSLFETPNLTPIINEKSFMPSTNPNIVGRARKVAARLYYPPSPELATPDRPRSLFLSGLDAKRSFSTSVPEDSALMDTPPLFSNGKPQPETVLDASKLDSGQETEVIKGGASSDEEEGVQEILELLCVLGAAHKCLCQYQCSEALRIFYHLPQEQFHTGWVLHQVGRACFEMADYQNAKRHLELMQQAEPHRMKGLEVLSTTLWHLKKEVELAHLAQRAVEFDSKCPECWCIVGNCFSLQKEHETALTFFRRSIQLDPSFTYPHTLSGHEYAAIEDFDKAVSCYRDAIRADERHYNAWYGLGALYFRQEKYDLAEYHFHRALTINTQSSVLHCHLGMAQHSNGKTYQALDTLAGAFRLDPRNPQARYQRATIYMAMDRPHEALMELEKVRDAVPREATIHFAMGRVLKRIGRPEQAMRSFLIALDLDPKDANLIKAAMEKMDEPDVDEEVSAF